jgi:DNA-binding NtrC family response regulator
LDALESEAFSLVITDLGMPDVSGQVVARRSRELYPNVPVVLATGWGDTITPEQLEEMGVQGLLPKPFTYSQVRRILSQHLVQSQEKSTLSKKSSPMS